VVERGSDRWEVLESPASRVSACVLWCGALRLPTSRVELLSRVSVVALIVWGRMNVETKDYRDN
jgi:hypothetical protein